MRRTDECKTRLLVLTTVLVALTLTTLVDSCVKSCGSECRARGKMYFKGRCL